MWNLAHACNKVVIHGKRSIGTEQGRMSSWKGRRNLKGHPPNQRQTTFLSISSLRTSFLFPKCSSTISLSATTIRMSFLKWNPHWWGKKFEENSKTKLQNPPAFKENEFERLIIKEKRDGNIFGEYFLRKSFSGCKLKKVWIISTTYDLIQVINKSGKTLWAVNSSFHHYLCNDRT